MRFHAGDSVSGAGQLVWQLGRCTTESFQSHRGEKEKNEGLKACGHAQDTLIAMLL